MTVRLLEMLLNDSFWNVNHRLQVCGNLVARAESLLMNVIFGESSPVDRRERP